MLTTNSVATGKKLKRINYIIFIAIIAVSVILLSAFLDYQQIQPKATPLDFKLIQSVSGYYLSYMGNVSKIFVVSANASYGGYPYPTAYSPPWGPPNSISSKWRTLRNHKCHNTQ